MASPMTELDVVNRALVKLGSTKITSLTADSKDARVMNNIVDPVRDRFLRSNPWNPAVDRAILAKDTVAPAWGFASRFILPADFLKLLNVESSGRVFSTGSSSHRTPPLNIEYRLEGDYILTNESNSLNIRYVKRLTDMSRYTSDMLEALSTLYAVEACMSITGDLPTKRELRDEYDELIKIAKRNDGWEDDRYIFPDDSWLTVRF